jgi:hypothetical protein
MLLYFLGEEKKLREIGGVRLEDSKAIQTETKV